MNISRTAFVLAACAACSVGTTEAGVFDDVAYWLRSPVDRNGDGYMSNAAADAEYPDALHGSDLTQTINGAYSSAPDAYKYAIDITNEDVTSYYPIARTYRSVPVLHLNHAFAKDASTGVITHVPARVNLPDLFPYNYSDGYTAVMRVRYEGALPICKDGTAVKYSSRNVVLSLGLNESSVAANARGVALAFSGGTGPNQAFSCYVIFGGQYYSFSPAEIKWDNRLLTDRWFDVALRMDGANRKVTVLWSTTSDILTTKEYDYPVSATNVASITSTASIGYETRTAPTSDFDPFYLRAFKGSVARLAIWHRALSDEEVKEAIAAPRPSRFQIGRADGASSEFGGTTDAVVVPEEGDWSQLPAALTTALPSLATKFSFDENPISASNSVRALAIVAKMTADSGSGRLQATVNGTSVGESTFGPRDPAVWMVPASVLADENQLVLRHVSGGAAKLDCLSGGASWQVGYENNSGFKDGFGAETYTTFDLGLLSFAKFGRVITGPGHGDYDRTIHVRLTEDEVSNFRYQFSVKWNHSDQAGTGMTTTNAVSVNGSAPVLQEIKGGFVTTTLDLDAKDLVPGDNLIKLYRHDRTNRGASDYDEIDYVRFVPVKCHKPSGLVIIFR